MGIKIEKQDNTLCVELDSRLDRNNSKSVLEDIYLSIDESIEKLRFDANNLRRITSDGLDVFLELKLKYGDIEIDNAGIGICDVFQAHGFSNAFVKLNKKYRFVSVKDCEAIGNGGHGTIYKIDTDTIVKVYRDNSSLDTIENERRYARNAFINGVPTAIAYDVVETELGYGVIFEMLNGTTLGKFLKENPDKVDENSVKFADLLLKLNTTIADETLYPDFHDVYLQRAENAKKFIGEKGGEKLKRIINSIPRGIGMIHGDFHPNNVMIDEDGELLLIDMADISRGNGFFDIGGTSLILSYLANVSYMRKKLYSITSLDGDTCKRIWDILVKRYYKIDDADSIEKVNKLCSMFGDIRMAASLGMKSSHSKFIDIIVSIYVKLSVLPKEKKYIEVFKDMTT